MKLESHPLVSHAPKEKKKRQESEGRRQRHGWIVVGLRMSIFEAHTRCFSVSLRLENPPCTFPAPTGPYRAGCWKRRKNPRITFTLRIVGDDPKVTFSAAINHVRP